MTDVISACNKLPVFARHAAIAYSCRLAQRELALKSTAALVESTAAAKAWQDLCERSQKVTDDLIKTLRPAAVADLKDEDVEKYYRPSRWVN